MTCIDKSLGSSNSFWLCDSGALTQTWRQRRFKMTSQSLNFFAIIPTHLICLMKPNCLGAEFVRTALQFREKNKNSPSLVHVLHKTLNLVTSLSSWAQDGKGMNHKAHSYRVIVLPIIAFVLSRPRQPSPLCLRKLLSNWPANGMVTTHASMTFLNNDQSTTSLDRTLPTMTTEPTLQWVVLIGIPRLEAHRTVSAEPISITKPLEQTTN